MPFVGVETITVITRTVSKDRRGRAYVEDEDTIPGVKATVNPIPGKVLETLPEGEREGDQRRVITEYELRAASEKTGYPGDHLIYEGVRYEVREVQPYRRVIPHLEVRVRALDPTEEPRYDPDLG